LTNIYTSITGAFYFTFCQNSQFIEKNIKRENSDFYKERQKRCQ
jgi:hypothetical protein